MHDEQLCEHEGSRGSPYSFLKVMTIVIASVVMLVLAVNLTAFNRMISKDGMDIAQMVSGWGRIYKPILHDRVKAEYLFFGASWVRDSFDPKMLRDDYGVETFNFGVSGGRPYESRRFLMSALAVHKPKAVFLNLDSFYEGSRQTKTEKGFDDRILNTTEDGTQYPYASQWRYYNISLGGSALGHNFKFLKYWYRLNKGMLREEVIRSYDRYDFEKNQQQTKFWRNKLAAEAQQEQRFIRYQSQETDLQSAALNELTIAVKHACAKGIDVHTWTTPHGIFKDGCNDDISREMQFYNRLQALAGDCSSKITMHLFNYPNPITMEGFNSEARVSDYYRKDGHPRPTIGRLVFARILDLPYPKGILTKESDFGVQLMELSDQAAVKTVYQQRNVCPAIEN